MKRYYLFAILAAALLCAPSALRPSPEEGASVTVLFTGDVGGYLKPCG